METVPEESFQRWKYNVAQFIEAEAACSLCGRGEPRVSSGRRRMASAQCECFWPLRPLDSGSAALAGPQTRTQFSPPPAVVL